MLDFVNSQIFVENPFTPTGLLATHHINMIFLGGYLQYMILLFSHTCPGH